MGLDFIRRTGGNFKKSWNKGAQSLASPDLYTMNPECVTRSILGALLPGATAKPKEKLILQCEGAALVAYRDIAKVASNSAPPADLFSAIKSCGGYALVVVEKVHERSKMVDLLVKE